MVPSKLVTKLSCLPAKDKRVSRVDKKVVGEDLKYKGNQKELGTLCTAQLLGRHSLCKHHSCTFVMKILSLERGYFLFPFFSGSIKVPVWQSRCKSYTTPFQMRIGPA